MLKTSTKTSAVAKERDIGSKTHTICVYLFSHQTYNPVLFGQTFLHCHLSPPDASIPSSHTCKKRGTAARVSEEDKRENKDNSSSPKCPGRPTSVEWSGQRWWGWWNLAAAWRIPQSWWCIWWKAHWTCPINPDPAGHGCLSWSSGHTHTHKNTHTDECVVTKVVYNPVCIKGERVRAPQHIYI